MDSGVLFIRLRLLGDIIFTLPALQLFRRFHPGVPLLYVVEERFREIGELLPPVDELIVVPHKMSPAAVWKFGRGLRRRGIDTVVDFHSGPKSALLTLSTRAARRVGYRTPNRNLAYNRLVPRRDPELRLHSVFNQVRLLAPLGIEVAADGIPPYPPLAIRQEEVGTAVREFAAGADRCARIAVIHIGAGGRFRDWGEGNFLDLTARLAGRGAAVALVGGGPAEVRRGAALAARTGARDFTGRLAIRDLIWLVSRSGVYVGADSGPLHAASLSATPIVALYGPNLPAVSGPWRRRDVMILERPLACRPCSQRRCLYDTMKCLCEISVDEVYEAASRFLF